MLTKLIAGLKEEGVLILLLVSVVMIVAALPNDSIQLLGLGFTGFVISIMAGMAGD